MVTRFRSINPVQLGVVSGVMYALMGLLIALLMMPFLALMAAVGANHSNFPAAGMFGGVVGLLIVPILYGVLGFIGGIISALIYNLVASWTGGIEVTMTHVATMETVPATVTV